MCLCLCLCLFCFVNVCLICLCLVVVCYCVCWAGVCCVCFGLFNRVSFRCVLLWRLFCSVMFCVGMFCFVFVVRCSVLSWCVRFGMVV